MQLCNRALNLLGDAKGAEADALRDKLTALQRKYERFSRVFELVPITDGPIDLEEVLDGLPSTLMGTLASMARRALGLAPRDSDKKVAARKL